MFIVNVEGAVFHEDKWLIIKRSSKEEHAAGLLSLIGGKVDHEGNSKDILERTLKRELFEEVGIIVEENMKFLRNTSFVLENGTHVLDIVFLCQLESGTPYIKSPDEVETIFWMKAEEIMDDANAPIWLRESIQAAEDMRKQDYIVT